MSTGVDLQIRCIVYIRLKSNEFLPEGVGEGIKSKGKESGVTGK